MNRHREKTVNTPSNPLKYVPSIVDVRMSRIRYPRGTLIAMVLLAAVFVLFGVFASAAQPQYPPAPEALMSITEALGDWLTGCTCLG